MENVILGGIAGEATDLIIDVPLSYMGLLKSVDIYEGTHHVIGYGTGDLVVDISGILLILYGDQIGAPPGFGWGWLLAHLAAKMGELYADVMRWSDVT